ncbi:MAG: flagellar brake protein [Clostridiales bacterium]|nr:flagellar brake protein [Clostridiales bacterium]
MSLSDMFVPGDKIDIKLLHQRNKEENGGPVAPVYQSSICDYTSATVMEISMPTREGRMVLFQDKAECSLVFYTQQGMYECQGVVTGRRKEGGLYFLGMKITSRPLKFQRREFFRVDYLKDMQYYKITNEVAELETTEELFMEIQDFDYIGMAKPATIRDISGGGVRFATGEALEQGSFVLACMRLTGTTMDDFFYLVCQVIACFQNPADEDMYIVRSKFIFKDLKDREKIVKFVFEEERKARRRELGDSV